MLSKSRMRISDAEAGGHAFPPWFSWPLWEQPRHFELGYILNSAVTDALPPQQVGALGVHHCGLWECDLRDQSLVWSGGAYDIFGLSRGGPITREQSLAHYSEHSRARLRRAFAPTRSVASAGSPSMWRSGQQRSESGAGSGLSVPLCARAAPSSACTVSS